MYHYTLVELSVNGTTMENVKHGKLVDHEVTYQWWTMK